MKKLAIAVAMLITAIGIAVWSGIIFKNEMAALSSSLEGLLDISESCDDEVLVEETEKTIAVWNDASKMLHALVMHDAIPHKVHRGAKPDTKPCQRRAAELGKRARNCV